MGYSLAVDIGGTFTDIVLRRDDGELLIDKTLTTHDDLLEGFFHGVDAVLARRGLTADAVDGVVVHATTVVTNALIERKGRPTALVVTEGFTDVLEIRNEHRYDMFDAQIEFVPPLVPRELCFGVAERTYADGTVALVPDAAVLDALVALLRESGAEAVAICLLNAFVDGGNERLVADHLRAALPDLFVCISSEIAPQIREYHRASTTAVNAYAMPVSQPYLRRLSETLRTRGFASDALIMLSSGGVIGAEAAGRNPVRMIESGPAAGALAACHYAELLGLDRLMSFDMGGTTAKACLIEGRQPLVTGLFEVDRRYRFKEGSGLPVTVPSIDLIEIGAGGGSIARVGDMGLLKVGPDSAGSQPGPACYGRGGTHATVTDADLMLGLLDPANFLGGDMALDVAATEAAIGRLAQGLGVAPMEAARGIYRIVIDAMASAARTHATDRGVDYRGLPLFAFGGAGALHACGVAELLDSTSVIIPPQSSVLSAFGTLVTPVRLDLVRSDVGRLDAIDWARVDALLEGMAAEGRAALIASGCGAEAVTLSFGADLRFVGQQHEVSVAFASDPRIDRDLSAIRQRFEESYVQLYSAVPDHVPAEVVTWKVTASGAAARDTRPPAATMGDGTVAPRTRRVEAWAEGGEARVYRRADLACGTVIDGPAVIEERETTTALPPGWRATIDALGCIVATRDGREGVTA